MLAPIKQMKRQLQILTVCLLMTLTFSVDTYGQCTADAGSDTTLCISLFGLDTFYLGGIPTAIGGIPPYTYTWTCTYTIITLTFNASDFLDDTTAANPLLLGYNNDTLTFYLSVMDGLGNTCTDSTTIGFCQFALTLEDKQVQINQGDTAQLYPGVGQGCPPLTFKWMPNYNISDPNIPNPLVWPDTTTYYVAMVTDSAGCQAYDETFEVFVIPAGLNEQDKDEIRIDIFPNPLTQCSIIKISRTDRTDFKMDFYDTLGRTIKQMTITDIETKIKRRDFNAGIYFYRLFDNDIPVCQGKLIVE